MINFLRFMHKVTICYYLIFNVYNILYMTLESMADSKPPIN